MTTQTVTLTVEGPCGWVTLNRPERHNALSSADWSALRAVLTEAEENPEIRVVALRGAGTKAFSTGADLAELAARDAYAAYENALRLQKICAQVAALRKPSVAMLRGYAVGGGFELALACSFRIAARDVRVGLPEVAMGTLAGAGGTQRISRMAPRGTALRMLLLGELLDAEQARQAGIIDEVVDEDRLAGAVTGLAGKLAKTDPRTVALILDSVRLVTEAPLAAGLAGEAALFGLTIANDTHREHIADFLEKSSR